MIKKLFFLIISAFILISCGGNRSTTAELRQSYAPKYASGFELSTYGKYPVIKVKHPWQGASGTEFDYILVDSEEKFTDPGFIPINYPVRRAVCMSGTHIAFLDVLDKTDIVCGVSGGRYIMNEKISNGFREGTIPDIGYDANVNYELVASLKPDVVFIYGISGENSMSDKLAEMGIPTMYIGDYIENTPLGKAEWVVVFGELTGKRKAAEKYLRKIEESYNSLKNRVTALTKQTELPTVMLNVPWRDQWFVPGDRNYMVKLLEDAGADYVCSGVDSDVSRALAPEVAYLYASRSDFWLNPGSVETVAELVSLDSRFSKVPAVRKRNIYNCNQRRTTEGGSDFWESGAVNPDLILKDLVSIFYPDLLPGHSFYYYEKLPTIK